MTWEGGELPPRVFRMLPGVAFVRGLAEGLLAHAQHNLLSYHVILPTQRACAEFRRQCAMLARRGGLVLPKITALSDLHRWIEQRHLQAGEPPPPAELSETERWLLLDQLCAQPFGIEDFPAQRWRLIRSLARLLDMGEQHRVDWRKLETLVPESMAAHWQQTLSQLAKVRSEWLSPRRRRDHLSSEERQNHLFSAFCALLLDPSRASYVPSESMILAGFTGNVARTRDLMQAVLAARKGCVVMPAFEDEVYRAWRRSTEAEERNPRHPCAVLFSTLQHLGVDDAPLPAWGNEHQLDIVTKKRSSKPWLAAFYPAGQATKVTDQEERSALAGVQSSVPLRHLECHHEREEAQILALIIREFWQKKVLERSLQPTEPLENLAVITANDQLLTAVQLEVTRWGIHLPRPYPAHHSLAGTLARLCLTWPRARDVGTFLALCKHPWVADNEEISAFERQILRSDTVHPLLGDCTARLPSGALKQKLLSCFPRSLSFSQKTCAEWAQWHRQTLDNLQSPKAQDEQSERETDGALVVDSVLQSLTRSQDRRTLLLDDYIALFESLLSTLTVQSPYALQQPVLLLNPREAALLPFTHVVLAGMNEGTWPHAAEDNPWLNRAMMRRLGLPTADDAAGLLAHDLVQWCSQAQTVTCTRSIMKEGRPTTPSRWWMRLQAWSSSGDAARYRAWLSACGRSSLSIETREKNGATPPALLTAPCPDPAVRPRRISVTALETLQRNPFEYYCRSILRLRPLEPLMGDRRTLGRVVHSVLEHWVVATQDAKADGPESLLWDPKQALTVLMQRLHVPSGHQQDAEAWFTEQRLQRILHHFIAEQQRQRQRVVTMWTEVMGEVSLIDADGRPFTLMAKADRIDMCQDGSIELYDYKTGHIPTRRAVLDGRALQLPLEAVLVRCGGYETAFASIEGESQAERRVGAIHYWPLRGGHQALNKLSLDGEAVAAAMVKAESVAANLMAHFYEAPFDVYDDGLDSPYAHLARDMAVSLSGKVVGR